MARPGVGEAIGFVFQRRERTGVLTAATLAYFGLGALLFGGFLIAFWNDVVAYYAWSFDFQSRQDPVAAWADLPPEVVRIGPLYAALQALFLILFAAWEAACLRWLVRNETTPGFFGLGVGKDTWHLVLIYLTWFGVLVAAYIAMVIVIALAIVASIAVAGPLSPVMAAIGFIAGFLFFLAIIVRFSPAAAITVGKGDYAFFDAWKATRGRVLTLVASHLAVWLLYIVAMGVGTAAAAVFLWDPVSQLLNQPAEAWREAAAQPQIWAGVALFYAVMLPAAALLYLTLMGVSAKTAVVAHEEGVV